MLELLLKFYSCIYVCILHMHQSYITFNQLHLISMWHLVQVKKCSNKWTISALILISILEFVSHWEHQIPRSRHLNFTPRGTSALHFSSQPLPLSMCFLSLRCSIPLISLSPISPHAFMLFPFVLSLLSFFPLVRNLFQIRVDSLWCSPSIDTSGVI